MQNTPWDEIGTKIEIVDNLADAMREANIDFHVSVRQGYFQELKTIATKYDNYQYMVSEGHKYIVRDDTLVTLGTCTKNYVPLQNADAFGFFQDLIDEGVCTIDTIGKFNNGRKVWVLAKLTHQYWNVVPHDKIQMYLLFVNSHDGQQSVMAGVLPIRVWCSNMFHQLKGQDLIKFRHTGDVKQKTDNVRELILEQLKGVKDLIIQLKNLADRLSPPVLIDKYFREVFNCPEGCSRQGENKIKKLKDLYVNGTGNSDEYVRGTWYAAYNAVTEYLSFEAGNKQESRIKSLWFGTNKRVTEKAFSLALEMSKER